MPTHRVFVRVYNKCKQYSMNEIKLSYNCWVTKLRDNVISFAKLNIYQYLTSFHPLHLMQIQVLSSHRIQTFQQGQRASRYVDPDAQPK